MMEPMVSVPMARGVKPAERETADPVEEPPGALTGQHGDKTGARKSQKK